MNALSQDGNQRAAIQTQTSWNGLRLFLLPIVLKLLLRNPQYFSYDEERKIICRVR